MKRPVIAVVIAGLLIATSASAVLAKTTKIEVVGTASPTGVLSQGTMTTHGNFVMTLGFTDTQTSDPAPTNNPYVAGDQVDVVNWIGNTKTNRGVLWGTGVHTPTLHSDGTWKCAFVGVFSDFAHGVWSGKGACYGTGSLRGWRWIADLASTPNRGTAMHGYIFFPGR